MSEQAHRYLTTRELADLLRIKERKVYELAASGEVPCSRAMGKLLFPREQVDIWLSENSSGPSVSVAPALPAVMLGSHDPLLDWAMRESRCGLAANFDSSLDGLERLAMYVQGVDNVYDLNFNGGEGDDRVSYGDVFLQAEQEYSRHNFEHADTATLLQQFRFAEAECKALLKAGDKGKKHLMALPAYDQCIKASHVFNLLDARGVISVTERQAYILRVRDLAKGCCEAWAKTAGGSAQHNG